jgi:hypothetical protein
MKIDVHAHLFSAGWVHRAGAEYRSGSVCSPPTAAHLIVMSADKGGKK